MLKSRIRQTVSNYPNGGVPGYFSGTGQVCPSGNVSTVGMIDNRELRNTDGFIELTGFGTIYNPDPNMDLSDDLLIVFGDETNRMQEVVLFDKVHPIETSFTINFQLHQFANAYEGAFTINFSTGEQVTQYVYLPGCSDNNFTSIRFKNTKQSSGEIEITIRAFNVLLHH